jgi:glycolate oxidase iron-sulfur subunit
VQQSVHHEIDIEPLHPHGEDMARAVATCVHCGFCLPACPTYAVQGEEMDSPRGRIFLMKSALEGRLRLVDALPYVDRCLGCVACVTACPSGVKYGELLTPFRALAESRRHRPMIDRLRRHLVLETLPYPGRFRLAARFGQLTRPLARLVPSAFRAMLDLLPRSLPPEQPLPELVPAAGPRRARVALLAGCAQQVLAPGINHAALRVLSRAGVEVVVPRAQVCCGALPLHVGDDALARELASANLRAFPEDVDAIITTASGCGSGMHEYPFTLKNTPEEDAAARLAAKVVDVAVFLERLGPGDMPPLKSPMTVAYHDACHLLHAQNVRDEPRSLLARIPNLTLVELPDTYCCGSAGTYNLDQPVLAGALGTRKARAILTTEADAVVMGNIGCLTQIKANLDRLAGAATAKGRPEVLHTIELIDRAQSGRV